MKAKMKKIACAIAAVLLMLMLLLGIIVAVYISKYYHADDKARDIVTQSHSEYQIQQLDDAIAFVPDHPKAGLIFYPGGKVEYTAYAPLMEACAKQDILCVLVHMTGNLAVLESDAADGIPQAFPAVDHWYIGGHSLGGAMAATYVSEHIDAFDGLVLLASYATKDLSGTNLKVLSVYGTNDGVMNRESYEANKCNLPDDFTEIVIPDANHAGFGSYGAQEGDGQGMDDPWKQVDLTAAAIAALVED